MFQKFLFSCCSIILMSLLITGTTSKSKTINKHQKMAKQPRRVIAEAKEEGASSWLSVLPLEEFGFVLKEEFRDALRL